MAHIQNALNHKYWEFPNMVVSNLAVCNLFTQKRSSAPFCTLVHPFADLHLRSFALIYALLRTSKTCVFLRLEWPRLGTSENTQNMDFEEIPNVERASGPGDLDLSHWHAKLEAQKKIWLKRFVTQTMPMLLWLKVLT